jgi:hypothetical protein
MAGFSEKLDSENPAGSKHRSIFGELDSENPAVSKPKRYSENSTPKIPRSPKTKGLLDESTPKTPRSQNIAEFSDNLTPKISLSLRSKGIFGQLDSKNPAITELPILTFTMNLSVFSYSLYLICCLRCWGLIKMIISKKFQIYFTCEVIREYSPYRLLWNWRTEVWSYGILFTATPPSSPPRQHMSGCRRKNCDVAHTGLKTQCEPARHPK